MPIFSPELDFNSISNMDIISQMKYELLEVEYSTHIYFSAIYFAGLTSLGCSQNNSWLVSTSASGPCPLQRTPRVLGTKPLLSPGTVVSDRMKWKRQGRQPEGRKQLETAEESYRNKSTRHKHKDMTKAWYPVSRNMLEVLSCPLLGKQP